MDQKTTEKTTPNVSKKLVEGTKGKRLFPKEMIPKEFLKIIAVWSLIPSYIVAGGFIGYVIDQSLKVFPYATGAGILLALILSVRDMLRLRDIMWK